MSRLRRGQAWHVARRQQGDLKVDCNWRHARPRWMRPMVCGFLLVVFFLFSYHPGLAQSSARKLKNRVEPLYPELAKRNNITGTARLEVLVAADGHVKDIKVLGGSPVLVQAAVAAVTKWKYEPAAEESSIVIKFEFNP